MRTATRLQRLSAAIAAVLATLSIVWGISGYAYPDAPSYSPNPIAKDTPVRARS
jgi:hypothetical protein